MSPPVVVEGKRPLRAGSDHAEGRTRAASFEVGLSPFERDLWITPLLYRLSYGGSRPV
jgi:hypothetical protein